jgi:hypothetical protein
VFVRVRAYLRVDALSLTLSVPDVVRLTAEHDEAPPERGVGHSHLLQHEADVVGPERGVQGLVLTV